MMSKVTRHIFTGLILLICFSYGSAFFTRQGDGPEDESVATMVNTLGVMLDGIIDKSLRLISPDLPVGALEDVISGLDLTNTSSSECRQCVAFTGLLISLVDNGVTFEDLRDLAIDVCYNVTENEGWDGSLICEGVIDNYGPHVVYIANHTEMTAEEACLTLNECQPDDIEPTASDNQFIPHGQSAAKGKHGVSSQSAVWSQRPMKSRGVADYEGAIRVVHITDLHNDPEYDIGADNGCSMPMCCRDEWPGSGYAGPWGSYNCNLPLHTTDFYLDFVRSLEPDLLLYTGDTPPNTVWLETLEFQINMSRIIAEKIQTRLPGVPAFSVLGNHECFPTNLYHLLRTDTQELNREFALMWQTMSNFTQEQLDTMDTGGYYSVLVKPGLRVLGYNTNFVATANWYVLLDQLSNGYGAMRQYMEDTFAYARENDEKVILLGHHLSGSGGRLREWSEFITDLGRRNADLIVLHLFGHSHKDGWQLNTDPVTGDVFDMQISTASMSSSPEMNPNARLFYLDNSTLEVLDMDTYFLDLQDPINNGSEPVIRLQYRATVEYGMVDCTPESYKYLLDRMQVDDDLFAKYRANYVTQTGFEGECDEECKKETLCDMSSTSYNQVQQCNDRF